MVLPASLRLMNPGRSPFRRPSPFRRGQGEAVRAVLQGARGKASSRLEREADDLSSLLEPRVPISNGAGRLAGGGRTEPLPEGRRRSYEARLGVDLEEVRIHSGYAAQNAAKALGAEAFTVGRDIFLANPGFSGSESEGRKLLAHEVVHVVQQKCCGVRTGMGPISVVGRAPLSVQCSDHEGSSWEWSPGGRPWWERPLVPGLELRLDPEIEAQLALMRMRTIQHLLDPDNVRDALLDLDPAILGSGGTDWLNLPPVPEPSPLVTPGAGPATPRPGTPGDLIRAVVSVPAVNTALTNLRTSALQRVQSDWGRLSTGERILLVSQGVILGGGALAGALGHEESRNWLLNQVQGRDLPVPLVPGLSFQFNLTGRDQRIFFTLDLARLGSP